MNNIEEETRLNNIANFFGSTGRWAILKLSTLWSKAYPKKTIQATIESLRSLCITVLEAIELGTGKKSGEEADHVGSNQFNSFLERNLLAIPIKQCSGGSSFVTSYPFEDLLPTEDFMNFKRSNSSANLLHQLKIMKDTPIDIDQSIHGRNIDVQQDSMSSSLVLQEDVGYKYIKEGSNPNFTPLEDTFIDLLYSDKMKKFYFTTSKGELWEKAPNNLPAKVIYSLSTPKSYFFNSFKMIFLELESHILIQTSSGMIECLNIASENNEDWSKLMEIDLRKHTSFFRKGDTINKICLIENDARHQQEVHTIVILTRNRDLFILDFSVTNIETQCKIKQHIPIYQKQDVISETGYTMTFDEGFKWLFVTLNQPSTVSRICVFEFQEGSLTLIQSLDLSQLSIYRITSLTQFPNSVDRKFTLLSTTIDSPKFSILYFRFDQSSETLVLNEEKLLKTYDGRLCNNFKKNTKDGLYMNDVEGKVFRIL